MHVVLLQVMEHAGKINVYKKNTPHTPHTHHTHTPTPHTHTHTTHTHTHTPHKHTHTTHTHTRTTPHIPPTHSPIYAWVLKVVSFSQVSQPKACSIFLLDRL